LAVADGRELKVVWELVAGTYELDSRCFLAVVAELS
jgi:hypothetical protein